MTDHYFHDNQRPDICPYCKPKKPVVTPLNGFWVFDISAVVMFFIFMFTGIWAIWITGMVFFLIAILFLIEHHREN